MRVSTGTLRTCPNPGCWAPPSAHPIQEACSRPENLPFQHVPREFPMKVWKQMLRTNASGQQPDPSSLKKRTHNQHQQMREPSLRLCKHGKWRVAAGGQGWEHLRGQPPEEVAFLHPEEKRLHTLPPAHSREGCGFVTQGLGRHHGKPKWETRHPKNSGEMKEAYLF